jgi:hypothetical protein
MSDSAPRDLRTQIIRTFTFLGGIYFFIYFLLPERAIEYIGLKNAHQPISDGFTAIGVMAIGLGLINLITSHGSKVAFLRPGWINSLALLSGLFLMLTVTAMTWIQGLSVAGEVRAIQMIGDFAAKISDEATKPEVAATRLPPRERVRLLGEYADRTLASVDAHLDTSALNGREGHEVQQGLTQLVTECRGAATRLREVLARARSEFSQSGGTDPSLSDSQRGVLAEMATAGAKVSSTYALVVEQERKLTGSSQLYTVLYDGLFTNLGSAMFSLLGVYIATAAFRAFRVRTVESALMMGAALLVMLGQMSVGASLSKYLPNLPEWLTGGTHQLTLAGIRQWLLDFPSNAAFRAIKIGAGVAGLMLSIRMWLSIESRSFSGSASGEKK